MTDFRVTHHPEVPAKCQARWCGPAAMSAVTGLSAEECAAAINASRGRPAYYQTQRVSFDSIGRHLHDLGFKVTQVETNPIRLPTIRKFATDRNAERFLRPILFWTRDHFLAICEKTLADSNFPDGVAWRDYDKLRTQVRGYVIVEPDRERTQGLDGWEPSLHNHYARKRDRVRGAG